MSKTNKFLFDLNNFDTPETLAEEIVEIDETPVEPPAPTFSEDDLEAARAVAHSNGRNEGIKEEKQKRDQFIGEQLQHIVEKFSDLFAAEQYRERQYEEESIKLALQVVSMLAPSLNDRLGEEALKATLKDVLVKQSGQSEMRIEVHPESAADITTMIDDVWNDEDNRPQYKVVANSELEKGACDLSWKDGGMIRKPEQIAANIKTALEELLVEQVMSKTELDVTTDENNGIKNQQPDESVDQNQSKPDIIADQNGENHE